MIIGIDASKAAVEKRTGVENYVYQLILSLSKIDHEHVYFLYTNKKLPSELTRKLNFIEKLIPFRVMWNKIRLPLALLKDKPDVYLQPAYMIPAFAPKRSAAVIHDFAWKLFAQAYSSKDRFLQRATMRNIARKSAKIICVSKSAQNDLSKFYPALKSRSSVVYLAGDSKLKKIDKPKDVLKLEEKYFLAAGRLEERKNTVRIIEAFFEVKSRGLPHKLVLAGKPGYGYDRVLKSISSNALFAKDVVIPGYVGEEKKNDIFSAATALVYPSLYEGFGITALDAMNSGCPVITSDSSSLPEIVKDAAIRVDPGKCKEIAEAMMHIAKNMNLRDKLIRAGFDQAAKFSWERTARETLAVLEKL